MRLARAVVALSIGACAAPCAAQGVDFGAKIGLNASTVSGFKGPVGGLDAGYGRDLMGGAFVAIGLGVERAAPLLLAVAAIMVLVGLTAASGPARRALRIQAVGRRIAYGPTARGGRRAARRRTRQAPRRDDGSWTRPPPCGSA